VSQKKNQLITTCIDNQVHSLISKSIVNLFTDRMKPPQKDWTLKHLCMKLTWVSN